MIPRRDLVLGSVLGGVVGALSPATEAGAAPANAAAADVSDVSLDKIAQAIAALRNDVQSLRTFSDIAPVREVQLTYLRANGKFPDFVEVGTSVWFGVHDWHVRWLQPMTRGSPYHASGASGRPAVRPPSDSEGPCLSLVSSGRSRRPSAGAPG